MDALDNALRICESVAFGLHSVIGVTVGLRRIVALHDRSSTSYQIRKPIR
jgi:hypothetical protein